MSKVAVVYWSGTGNTEAMADKVVSGAEAAGASVTRLGASEFHAADVSEYDGIAFGCPAMGDEVLEETEVQPMWDEVKDVLSGKKIGLFGSYGWGDGQWMESWKEEAENAGAVVTATVICADAPDENACSDCEALGKALA